METQLREAEACDSLKHLRQGLRARTMTSEFKLKNITGQIHNTRTQGVLRKIDLQVYKNKIRYRHARSAILSLKGCGKWEKELKVLDDDDVRGLSERALSQEERAQEEARREQKLEESMVLWMKFLKVIPPSFLVWEKAVEPCLGSGTTRLFPHQTPHLKMVCSATLSQISHTHVLVSCASRIRKSKSPK